MGQTQNLTKGWDGLGQQGKIRDRTRDGMVRDFDSLSHPVPRDKTGQSRKVRSKTEKGRSKTGKGHSKTEYDALKQERIS